MAHADKPTVAFVLSGGASLGAVQVGMLRALYERGIAPHVIVGTSAGAINGAFIASRPQAVRDAASAAAAVPGVLPPGEWNGRILVDGGVANNTPISHAIALGAQ